MYLDNSKKLIYSKTFWAGMGTIITSIGFLVSGEQELQEFIMGVVGFIFIVLRMVTNQPIKD